MRAKAIMAIEGVEIQHTRAEALEVARGGKALMRIKKEIRAMLNGCGVDPDTGKRIPTALPRGYEQLPPATKKTRVKCDWCGGNYDPRGLRRHKIYCKSKPTDGRPVEVVGEGVHE